MNKYLEKIALTRLVKELAIGRVNTSVNSLLRSGFIRSPSRYAHGMREGVNALAAGAGADISRVKNIDTYQGRGVTRSGGYATSVSKNGGIHIYHDAGVSSSMHVGPGRDKKTIAHQAGLMHESFEAQALRRDLDSNVKESPAAEIIRNKYLTYASTPDVSKKPLHHATRFLNQSYSPETRAVIFKDGVEKARHQSLAVLGQESNMVRANPYLRSSDYPTHRLDSGEAGYIHKLTGKRYGMDRFTGRDLKNLDTSKPTLVVNGNHVHVLT